jgi:hypothetical protein
MPVFVPRTAGLIPKTKTGRAPTAGYLKLLIKRFHSCPPYPEASSSIHILRTHNAVVTINTEHKKVIQFASNDLICNLNLE